MNRKDYLDYVDFCFKTFGDHVKLWVTINEPNGICINGYTLGTIAPGRCSNYVGNCTAGNSATEPYVVAHNLLLAHGGAVKLYKDKNQVCMTEKRKKDISLHYLIKKINNFPHKLFNLLVFDWKGKKSQHIGFLILFLLAHTQKKKKISHLFYCSFIKNVNQNAL